MQSQNYLKLEFLSRPENVGIARLAIASFAAQLEFTLGELEEIKVAVSEAVSNAVIHGYGVDLGLVTVEASREGEEMRITVLDTGRGIEDIALARQPSFTTDPERMGLGFVFIESFMDQVEVESKPGAGTKVTMVKRCARVAGTQPA